jgi:hypothetical protein
MSLEALFVVVNYSVVPAWLLLALAPRWIWTRRAVHSAYVPVFLAIAYAVILFGDRPGPEGASFFTLAGVCRIFTSPRTVIACWLHYLVGDLFLGAWEVRDAERLRIPHVWVVPSLALTLFFGPLGLASWLVVRMAVARRVSLDEQATGA